MAIHVGGYFFGALQIELTMEWPFGISQLAKGRYHLDFVQFLGHLRENRWQIPYFFAHI